MSAVWKRVCEISDATHPVVAHARHLVHPRSSVRCMYSKCGARLLAIDYHQHVIAGPIPHAPRIQEAAGSAQSQLHNGRAQPNDLARIRQLLRQRLVLLGPRPHPACRGRLPLLARFPQGQQREQRQVTPPPLPLPSSSTLPPPMPQPTLNHSRCDTPQRRPKFGLRRLRRRVWDWGFSSPAATCGAQLVTELVVVPLP